MTFRKRDAKKDEKLDTKTSLALTKTQSELVPAKGFRYRPHN